MNEARKLLLRDRRGMGPIAIVLIGLLIVVAAIAAGVLVGYYTTGTFLGHGIADIFETPFGGKKLVRILILGEDNTGEKNAVARGLSDTIILASFDLQSGRTAMLSIPRDTRVDLNGYGGIAKINAAHVNGGPTLTALMVEQLTGIKPDYYMKTNVDGFKQCVDILGGVEIDVDKNMHYRDRRGGLYINLKKGPQLLDGEKAMQYVRFRHDVMGDISRIQRQQKFLRALAEQSLTPANLPKLPRIVNAVLRNVETDLSPKDALHLAKFVQEIQLNEVEMATLPGTPEDIGGISYWIADPEKTVTTVRELFFPELVARTLRVEVLNGSGETGMAQRVADILKSEGFEITSVGNADSHDYASSQIICRNSRARNFERIAQIVKAEEIRQEFDPSSKADLTVIVGKNCVIPLSAG